MSGTVVDGLLRIVELEETELQAGGEAVAAADPIDETDVVVLAAMERIGGLVVQHGAPPVVARRHAFAQRDGHLLRTKLLRHPRRRPHP